MPSENELLVALGAQVRLARKVLGIARLELAEQTGVSVRLLSEFERGERRNVSLGTALRLLAAVGVTAQFVAPNGVMITDASEPATNRAREARAAVRRATWTANRVPLGASGTEPEPSAGSAQRLVDVGVVSRQARVLSAAGRQDRVSERTRGARR